MEVYADGECYPHNEMFYPRAVIGINGRLVEGDPSPIFLYRIGSTWEVKMCGHICFRFIEWSEQRCKCCMCKEARSKCFSCHHRNERAIKDENLS